MDIVLCPDNNYVMPCGVLICSICENNKKEDIKFHIVTDEKFTFQNKSSLLAIIEKYECKSMFYEIDVSDVQKYLPIKQAGQLFHITLATYYRLFLSKLLPDNLDKVLYLDCDIIVCNNLNELWNTDIAFYAIAAVPDMNEGQIFFYNRLRYSQNMGYFNAGVLLINLNYWRENGILDRYIQFASSYPERVVYHDQDIMNYVLKDIKLSLPLRYNIQNGFLREELQISWEYEEELNKAFSNPCVLHYMGESKPWTKNCSHPYRELFFKYQRLTEWKDMPLQKEKKRITWKGVLKNCLYKIRILHEHNPYRHDINIQ